MPDLWFIAGLAVGIALSGFCAVGSFARGADSVRREPWAAELAARKRAVVASRGSQRDIVGSLSKQRAPAARPELTRAAVTGDLGRERGLALRAEVS